MIYVDEDSMRDGGKEVVDGIFYEGAALSTGQCGLRIQNYGGADVGRWSCTLISENGGTFTGAVLVGELRHCHVQLDINHKISSVPHD